MIITSLISGTKSRHLLPSCVDAVGCLYPSINSLEHRASVRVASFCVLINVTVIPAATALSITLVVIALVVIVWCIH